MVTKRIKPTFEKVVLESGKTVRVLAAVELPSAFKPEVK